MEPFRHNDSDFLPSWGQSPAQSGEHSNGSYRDLQQQTQPELGAGNIPLNSLGTERDGNPSPGPDAMGTSLLTDSKPPPLPSREKPKRVYTLGIARALGRFALFHVPAVAATVFLLVLYIKQISWNATADQLAGLLLAAKVHEALIIASLFDIVYYNICRALLSRRGVPFGYLTAAFQLNSPFYFLSKEFWAPMAMFGSATPWSVAMGLLLIFSFLLASLAGASSGIIMLPRLGWRPLPDSMVELQRRYSTSLGGFVVSPAGTMYPLRLDLGAVQTNCLDSRATNASRFTKQNCPFDDFRYPDGGTYAWLTDMNNLPSGTSNLSLSISEGRAVTLYSPYGQITVATCPLALVHRLLIYSGGREMYSEEDASVKTVAKLTDQDGNVVMMKQPRVVIQCSDDPVPLLYNQDKATASYEFRFRTYYYPGFNVTLDESVFDPALSSGKPFGFIDLNAHLPLQASIAIWNRASQDDDSLGLCLVDARWLPSDIWISPSGKATLIPQHSLPIDQNGTLSYRSADPKDLISIHPTWLDLLNATYIQADNHLNYSLVTIHGFFSKSLYQEDVATALAVYLANSLSFVPYAHTWEVEWSSTGPWKPDHNYARDAPFATIHDLDNYTLVTADYQHVIYTYDFGEITTVLSWAVLLLHLLLVLLHLIVVIAHRSWHTSAWSSLGQMMALGVNSSQTELLRNTGAGVKESAVWKLVASVREVEADGRVEIVLRRRDRVEEGGKLVQAGRKYN